MQKITDIPSVILEKNTTDKLGIKESPMIFLIPKSVWERLGILDELSFELFCNKDSVIMVGKNGNG